MALRSRSGTLAVLAAVLVLVLAPARARAADSDPATAEALFAAGRSALEQGDYETACAKLGESQRLDPAAGTLMNLADCNEKRGRLASAWENWRDALGTLRQDDERRTVVTARLGALEARLPRLVITLRLGAPAATVVVRDGEVLGRAALGVPLPVDPGPHRITARADGFEERAYTVSAEEGKTLTLAAAPGAKAVAAPPPATAPPPTAPPSKATPQVPDSASSPTQRTLGLVLGGIGAAALVTGAVTGILALDHEHDIEAHCSKAGDKFLCDPERVAAARSGKTLAVVSSIALPSGLALAGVGAALFLTAGHAAPPVSATVDRHGWSVAARGAF